MPENVIIYSQVFRTFKTYLDKENLIFNLIFQN